MVRGARLRGVPRDRGRRDRKMGNGAMQFGLLYDFRNPKRWEQSAPQLYSELLEQIARADQLGFDSV
jgi:hypothetical protein